MGFSFSTLAFKLWICLILFRTCLPQIQIFGGIAKCNNSVSFTDDAQWAAPVQALWHWCQCCGTGAKLDIEGGTWYWNPSDGTGAITAAPVP